MANDRGARRSMPDRISPPLIEHPRHPQIDRPQASAWIPASQPASQRQQKRFRRAEWALDWMAQAPQYLRVGGRSRNAAASLGLRCLGTLRSQKQVTTVPASSSAFASADWPCCTPALHLISFDRIHRPTQADLAGWVAGACFIHRDDRRQLSDASTNVRTTRR